MLQVLVTVTYIANLPSGLTEEKQEKLIRMQLAYSGLDDVQLDNFTMIDEGDSNG